MSEAWIIDGVRSPRGGGKQGVGSLSHIHPQRRERGQGVRAIARCSSVAVPAPLSHTNQQVNEEVMEQVATGHEQVSSGESDFTCSHLLKWSKKSDAQTREQVIATRPRPVHLETEGTLRSVVLENPP